MRRRQGQKKIETWSFRVDGQNFPVDVYLVRAEYGRGESTKFVAGFKVLDAGMKSVYDRLRDVLFPGTKTDGGKRAALQSAHHSSEVPGASEPTRPGDDPGGDFVASLESFTGTRGGEPNGTVVVIACGCSTGREEGAGEAGPEVPTCQGVDRLPELPVENTMLELITRVAIAHVRPASERSRPWVALGF